MASLAMCIDNKYCTQKRVSFLNFCKRLHNILQGLAQAGSQFSLEYLEIKPLSGGEKKNQSKRTSFGCRRWTIWVKGEISSDWNLLPLGEQRIVFLCY